MIKLNKGVQTLAVFLIVIALLGKASHAESTDSNEIRKYEIEYETPVDPHDGCVYTGEVSDVQVILENAQQGRPGRLLQAGTTGTPRNMRILTYFQQDIDNVVDGVYLGIAAKYYSIIFKVFPFEVGTSLILGTTCGNITVPTEIQNGFDVTKYDTVVLTRIYPDGGNDGNVLAFAGPCQFQRRPIVGQLNYRGSRVSGYINNGNYNFHTYVMVSTGISRLYENSTSTTRLTTSQIIANGVYNILPAVKKVVQDVHNCQTEGAKMQSSLSHWDISVWPSQVMAPSIGGPLQRMSYLSLALFEQTGWYAQVDYAQSWQIYDGYQQGCDYSTGANFSYDPPVACDASDMNDQCDLYSNYGGPCNAGGSVNLQFTNWWCQLVNPLTKCFESGVQRTSCLQAVCLDPTNIQITQGLFSANCILNGNPNFVLNGITYECPKNFLIFCDSLLCQDYSNQQGVCVNGRTHFLDCRQFIDGCQFCTQATGAAVQCNGCAAGFGLTLANNACTSSSGCGLTGCSTCTINSDDQFICIVCNTASGYTLQADGSCLLNSLDCSPIQSCQACIMPVSTLTCTNCGELTIGAGGTSCNLPTCSNFISNCQTCTDSDFNGVLQCTLCFGAWQLKSARICGVPTICGIANCDVCSVNSTNQLVCLDCANELIPNLNTCQKPVCSSVVAHCALCDDANADGFIECTSCMGDWQLKNPRTCGVPTNCGSKIPNCATCSVNSTDSLVCGSCNGELQLISNACQVPTNCAIAVAHCSTCTDSNSDGNIECTACLGSWFLQNPRSCIVPPICQVTIANCATCSINSTNNLVCNTCFGDQQVVSNACQPIACAVVIPNCASCADVNSDLFFECSACTNPWVVNPLNNRQCITPACQTIDPKCVTCQINNLNVFVCLTCRNELQLNAAGNDCQVPTNCRSIIPNCMTCTDTNDDATLECSICDGNLIPNPTNNRECVAQNCNAQFPGCLACSIDAQNNQFCSQCAGDKEFRNGICQFPVLCTETIANCENCNDNDNNNLLICTGCLGDWQLVGNTCQVPADCSTQIIDCRTCTIDSSNNQICLTCDGDKFVTPSNQCDYLECADAIDFCEICNDNDNNNLLTCTDCLGDWLLNSATNSCIQPTDCNSIIPDCTTCNINLANNLLQCTRCDGDLNLTGNACRQPTCSIANCGDCGLDANNFLICDACNAPYILSANLKSCDKVCSTNCQDCSVSGTNLICNRCVGDWVLQNNQCVAPNTANCAQYINLCATCTFASNVLTCNTCTTGNAPVNNVCLQQNSCRVANCKSCRSFASREYCFACKDGYAINYYQRWNQRTCVKCNDNCESCRVSLSRGVYRTQCYVCAPGYTLNNGECLRCDISNCDQCRFQIVRGNTVSSCLKCARGYGLTNNRRCTRCPSGCIQCRELFSGNIRCTKRERTQNVREDST